MPPTGVGDTHRAFRGALLVGCGSLAGAERGALRQDLVVQRIVVKEGFSRDMADMLLKDMRRAMEWFESQPGFISKKEGGNFHH